MVTLLQIIDRCLSALRVVFQTRCGVHALVIFQESTDYSNKTYEEIQDGICAEAVSFAVLHQVLTLMFSSHQWGAGRGGLFLHHLS